MDKLLHLAYYTRARLRYDGIENTFFHVFFMTFFQLLKTPPYKSKHGRKNLIKLFALISMLYISLHLSNDNVREISRNHIHFLRSWNNYKIFHRIRYSSLSRNFLKIYYTNLSRRIYTEDNII